MFKPRPMTVTARHALGIATANSDIASRGVVFAQTFFLSAVSICSDGFLDGYMLAIQRHNEGAS